MDSDIGRNADKISNLPDSVLSHLLSFLPTKDAVGTSVLSKRWQYLWTSVTSLDFNYSLPFPSRVSGDIKDEFDLKFMNFVNRVLFLCDASPLKKFSLQFWVPFNLDIPYTWISAAIERNVQELHLINHGINSRYIPINSRYIPNPIVLPHKIFSSKTLVDLTLDGGLSLIIPASVWLPCLKSLGLLDIRYENNESAQKLFSGCPVLEELLISYCMVGVLNISVPTLKRLTVFRTEDNVYRYSESIQELHNTFCKLVLNAPKLEYLALTDELSGDFSLEKLLSLSKAYIDIVSWDSFSSKLLTGIANVKFLHVWMELGKSVLPTFHNLTHLKFGVDLHDYSSWNLYMLKEFLEYSPNLEVLILEGNGPYGSGKFQIPSLVPPCFLLHLKEIEIPKFYGNKYELQVIKYLLKNAKVLKKMTIGCCDSGRCFGVELAGYPRGSMTCQLNLLLCKSWSSSSPRFFPASVNF